MFVFQRKVLLLLISHFNVVRERELVSQLNSNPPTSWQCISYTVIIIHLAAFLYTDVEPVDCQISGWTDWTECDSQCDLGWQTRFRMVTRPAAYGGLCDLEGPKQMEKRTCYLQSCDRMTTGK